MKQDTNIGTNILRVSASDEDADNNGAIRYSITAPVDPTDLDYFDIQPESGWIYLRKPLDVSQSLANHRDTKKDAESFRYCDNDTGFSDYRLQLPFFDA